MTVPFAKPKFETKRHAAKKYQKTFEKYVKFI